MPARKLTPDRADEIRRAKGLRPAKELAKAHGVSVGTVHLIWQGLAHRPGGRRDHEKGWKLKLLALVLRERVSSWEAAARLGVTKAAVNAALRDFRAAGFRVVCHNRGRHGSWIEVTNLRLTPEGD